MKSLETSEPISDAVIGAAVRSGNPNIYFKMLECIHGSPWLLAIEFDYMDIIDACICYSGCTTFDHLTFFWKCG